jgi:dTDP-4-dehydrorhamnose 3,5-epimerase
VLDTYARWGQASPRDHARGDVLPHEGLTRSRAREVKVLRVERIAGALVFEPTPIADERGFFCRTFDAAIATDAGVDPNAFTQDSVSRSVRGVVRGLHVRRGAGETKLVRCSSGAVYDVIVDLRPDSPTYRNWQSFDLDGDGQRSLYIPNGCAHGFQALTSVADVSYRIDRPHDPSEDVAIRFDAPELAIPWPVAVGPVSRRDQLALSLEDAVLALR